MNAQINTAFKPAENYIKGVKKELRNLQMQLVLSHNTVEAIIKNTGNLEMLWQLSTNK